MDSREKAILKTLLYADLFDYPLTQEEIFKFLISEEDVSQSGIEAVLKLPSLSFDCSKGYFYLTGRNSLVKKREKRKKISAQKLNKARKIIKKISLVPSIKFIGISGALSMGNADENDDIDLFVITEKDLVWTTRMLLIILLTVFGVYRNRQSKDNANKICLNMILDEKQMGFGKRAKDLYTAHEIAQLLPILNKGKTYQEFIRQNFWFTKSLPNFSGKQNILSCKNTFFDKFLINVFKLIRLEKISKFLQFNYMKSHITNEIVEEGFLKFHPFDYKNYVLKKYREKLSKGVFRNIL